MEIREAYICMISNGCKNEHEIGELWIMYWMKKMFKWNKKNRTKIKHNLLKTVDEIGFSFNDHRPMRNTHRVTDTIIVVCTCVCDAVNKYQK